MTASSILVPVDGSKESEAVLPYAMALANAQGWRLRLLRAISPDETNASLLRPGLDDAFVDALFDAAQNYVAELAKSLKQQGAEVLTEVLSGVPSDVILRMEKDRSIAMVAMATHGHGGLQRWALGSVADTVMRLGTVPALLFRPADQDAEQPDRSIYVNRLLIPLDGSALAEAALNPAARLAEATGAKLVLLRVEPWVNAAMAYATDAMDVPNLPQMEVAAEQVAAEYLNGIARSVPPGVSCETVVLRGNAGPVIQGFAETNQIDLVVMSTHGRTGLKRLVIGSKADALVRSGVPTLLIRTDMAARALGPTNQRQVQSIAS